MFCQRGANFYDGYDTDGEKGLYIPVVETVDDTKENDSLIDNAVPLQTEPPPKTAKNNTTIVGAVVDIKDEEVDSMSAAKIRKELKLRMVKQSGTKKELSNRLKFTTLQKKLKFTEGKMKAIKEKKKGGKKKLETKELKLFPATVHWRDFKQNNG